MPSFVANKSDKLRVQQQQQQQQHALDVTISAEEFERIVSAGFVPGGGVKAARIEMTQKRLAMSSNSVGGGEETSSSLSLPSRPAKRRRQSSMVMTAQQIARKKVLTSSSSLTATRMSASDGEQDELVSSGSSSEEVSLSQSTNISTTSRSSGMPKWLIMRMKNLYLSGAASPQQQDDDSANSQQADDEEEGDNGQDAFEKSLYEFRNPFEEDNPTTQEAISNFMDEDDVVQQHIDACSAAPPEICDMCQKPLIFTAAGDALTCNTPFCSTHLFPICDGTVASLPFGEEIYFTAAFSHNNAAKTKSTQAVKRENDIFGRTKAVISDQVVDYMRMCIQQSLGKTKASEITINDVYACAKVHGWTELYHEKLIPVFCRMTKRKMPDLVEEHHAIATNMYLMVRDAYYKWCKPANRKNFMDYLYLWYKIYDLVGAHHLLPYIRLLDAKNLATQDAIFHDICKRLNWKFTPTVPRPKPVIFPLTHLLVKTNMPTPATRTSATKKQAASVRLQPAIEYQVVSMDEE